MWSRLIFPLFRKNDNFYSATCTHPFYQWIWFGSRWWRVVIFCKVRAIVKQVLLLHVSQKQKHAHQDHIIIITILYLRWKQNIATFQKTSEDEVCGTLFMSVIVKMSIWSGGTLKIYFVGLLYFIIHYYNENLWLKVFSWRTI